MLNYLFTNKDTDAPPSLDMPKPKKSKKKKAIPVTPTWFNKLVCSLLGHSSKYFEWDRDGYGDMDGMTRCTRCGEWDV